MKISFLVTYYNQEQYVRESLNSILAIEKPIDWEILVGDDGSDDKTIDIIKEYVAKYPDRIFLYVMPREKGCKYNGAERASLNRLNLLEHSTGDYFCVLDGDDYYCDKDFLKDSLEIFELNKYISVVGFSFKYKYHDYDKINKFGKFSYNFRGEIEKDEYIRNYYTHAGACVFKKCGGGVERLEFIKTIGGYDDNSIVMNNLHYGGLYFINKPIYVYRQIETSTYNRMSEHEQDLLNVYSFDIMKTFLGEKYIAPLLFRNRFSIMKTYIWKNELKKLSNYDIYVALARKHRDSLLYMILMNRHLENHDKECLGKIIDKVKYFNIWKYIKLKVKYLIWSARMRNRI